MVSATSKMTLGTPCQLLQKSAKVSQGALHRTHRCRQIALKRRGQGSRKTGDGGGEKLLQSFGRCHTHRRMEGWRGVGQVGLGHL